jgi:hypothetical protein
MIGGGIYGVILLLISIFVSSDKEIGPPTIAVICITRVITALFSGLAGRSLLKMRQVRKAYLAPHPQAEKPQN